MSSAKQFCNKQFNYRHKRRHRDNPDCWDDDKIVDQIIEAPAALDENRKHKLPDGGNVSVEVEVSCSFDNRLNCTMYTSSCFAEGSRDRYINKATPPKKSNGKKKKRRIKAGGSALQKNTR